MDFDEQYRAYLLRLWRTEDMAWRATLEDAHTHQRIGFASLEQLLEFLRKETDVISPTEEESRDDRSEQTL